MGQWGDHLYMYIYVYRRLQSMYIKTEQIREDSERQFMLLGIPASHFTLSRVLLEPGSEHVRARLKH